MFNESNEKIFSLQFTFENHEVLIEKQLNLNK